MSQLNYKESTVARADPQPVGSEEWIRDNYHVVLDQIREVRQDLPKKFYFELPKLADGPGAGYPRVYYVASELVAHSAGRLLWMGDREPPRATAGEWRTRMRRRWCYCSRYCPCR